MVDALPDGTKGFGDFGVIHDPAELGIALALDGDLDLEAVAVKAAAFVGGGKVGQQVGGFELKCFAQFHELFLPVTPGQQIAEGGAAVVAPGQGRVLHFAEGTNAAGAPAGKALGQLVGFVGAAGKADGGKLFADRLGAGKGGVKIRHGFKVDETVLAGSLETGIVFENDGPGGGFGAGHILVSSECAARTS